MEAPDPWPKAGRRKRGAGTASGAPQNALEQGGKAE